MRRGPLLVITFLAVVGALAAAYALGGQVTRETIPAASPSPTITPSPEPEGPRILKAPEDFFIEAMRGHDYPGSAIVTDGVVSDGPGYTKYTIHYESDGLKITGLMSVPKRPGPLPAVILNHGFYPVPGYKPGDGTSREMDYLAERGYITVAPDYRSHAGSDEYPDPYLTRDAYAIDILNLQASLAADRRVQKDAIGVWGHSMGGGNTLKAIAIRPHLFKAAVVYGSMNADESQNYRQITTVWNPAYKPEFDKRFNPTSEVFAKMSASSYFDDFQNPIEIHHGTADSQVPYVWSVDLQKTLEAKGKPVQFFSYSGAGHIFEAVTWRTFMERVTAFYDRTLR